MQRRQPTLLVVGDSSLTRRQVVKAATALGYQSLEAATADEAVAIYERRRPQGVMVDISHVERQAAALIRALRALDAAARITVLSNAAPREVVMGLMQEGMRGFLVKPVPSVRLAQALQDVVVVPTERRHRRVALALRGALLPATADGPLQPCVVVDLSVGGARCRVERSSGTARSDGAIVQLGLVLPDGPLQPLARIARASGDGELGLAFLPLEPGDVERLERFLAWAAAHLARGGHGRNRRRPGRSQPLTPARPPYMPSSRPWTRRIWGSGGSGDDRPDGDRDAVIRPDPPTLSSVGRRCSIPCRP